MPTGYTAPVQDGKITEFRDFALQCARAFGALVEMRDEPMDAPIPEELKPSRYHDEAVVEAKAELAALERMSASACEALAEKHYQRYVREAEAFVKRQAQVRQRYEAMLAKVEAWTAPTRDHEGLKKFMADQLTESIRFDCGYTPEKPRRLSGAQWRTQERARLKRDISYHTAEGKKEVQRAKERTAWVKALRESLEQPARS